MALGRPKARMVVAPGERERLLAWARRPKTAQALALRARIVLKCAEGLDNIDVAEELRVTPQTVGRWRRRFLERRLAGLLDEPRPGAPRRISDAEIERVIVKTLESKPRDATHWSTRSMAQASGLRKGRSGEAAIVIAATAAAPAASRLRREERRVESTEIRICGALGRNPCAVSRGGDALS